MVIRCESFVRLASILFFGAVVALSIGSRERAEYAVVSPSTPEPQFQTTEESIQLNAKHENNASEALKAILTRDAKSAVESADLTRDIQAVEEVTSLNSGKFKPYLR